MPFVTTEPGTDLADPDDIKLLNWSGPFFVNCFNSSSDSSFIHMITDGSVVFC